eukprot:TRINITY_DN14668_c0_g1_i1.p1 TRINITY_DN14668_c0_g1~~TRINITY_DN14668_c0_g1_i1.p1  ORF type:complete len:345 (+),score=43.58 TRINITY_DN14668_c0_g1_i1:183-1217(+)
MADSDALNITVAGHTFNLSQTLSPSEFSPLGDDAWTGTRLWEASVLLTDFLLNTTGGTSTALSNDKGFAWCPSTSSVMEFGAGLGLCGIASVRAGASKVVLTDQEDVLLALRANVSTNLHGHGSTTSGDVASAQVTVVTDLDWRSTPHIHRICDAHGPFTHLLLSDCINPIYGMDSWPCLADMVQHACSHGLGARQNARRGHGDGDDGGGVDDDGSGGNNGGVGIRTEVLISQTVRGKGEAVTSFLHHLHRRGFDIDVINVYDNDDNVVTATDSEPHSPFQDMTSPKSRWRNECVPVMRGGINSNPGGSGGDAHTDEPNPLAGVQPGRIMLWRCRLRKRKSAQT